MLSLIMNFLLFTATLLNSTAFGVTSKISAGPIAGPALNRAVPCASSACPSFACVIPCPSANIANFDCLDITQDLTIGGGLVTRTQTVRDNIAVMGAVDAKNNIVVAGSSRFDASSCVEKSLFVNENISLSGSSTVAFLTINNPVFVTGNLMIIGDNTVGGNLFVGTNKTVDGDLLVLGSGTLNGPATANDGLTVLNGQTLNGGLTVEAGSGTIEGNVCVIGNELLGGALTVSNELVADQNAVLSTATVNGELITNNTFTANAGVTVANGSQIVSGGSVNVTNGNLSVSNLVTFNNKSTMNGGATFNDGLTVTNGQSIQSGNLDITTGMLVNGGPLTLNGPLVGTAVATFSDLTLTDTANSTSPTTGTLIVGGGAGIADDVWVGGSQYFNDVTADGGTPAPFNYYEETCFSTAFTWGGTTVQPLTSVFIPIVRVGDVVNLIIPQIIINNAGAHCDVITSRNPLPSRFRPCTTVRGASSTVITNTPGATPSPLLGALGEYNIDPSGTITIGDAGPNISPQLICSTDFVEADINTITYSVAGCQTNPLLVGGCSR